MNASRRSRRSPLQPIVLALGLAVPAMTAFAESMENIVTTRSDQTVEQQYGRDSVYAFSPASKPFSPRQTAGRTENALESGKSYSAIESRKTDWWAASRGQSATSSEPEWYGRAGGYVGADRVAYVQAHATPASESPSTVKTETSSVSEETTVPAPIAQSEPTPAEYWPSDVAPDPTAEEPASMQPEDNNGRMESDRFDHSDAMRDENGNGG